MALIQPCRGAPPEPLGDGTQASFQPSLKSVESGSGRQVFGSGLPKIDSVIVSKRPSLDPGSPPVPRRGSTRVGGRSSARASPPAESSVSTISAKLRAGVAAGGDGVLRPGEIRERQESDGERGREPASSQSESLASCHRSTPELWVSSIPAVRGMPVKSALARHPSPRCRCDPVSALSLRPEARSDFARIGSRRWNDVSFSWFGTTRLDKLTPIGLKVPSPSPRRGSGSRVGVEQRFAMNWATEVQPHSMGREASCSVCDGVHDAEPIPLLVLSTGSSGPGTTEVTPGHISRGANLLTHLRPRKNRPRRP